MERSLVKGGAISTGDSRCICAERTRGRGKGKKEKVESKEIKA